MKTVLLTGGLGTRLQEETITKPKPMVEVGGQPLIWHIMNLYSSQGFSEFILALGYKGEIVKNYFANYNLLHNSMTISLETGELTLHDGEREKWIVHLLDTGLDTQTGGRLKRVARFVGKETFMLTYGDGVSNIDLKQLLAFHREQGKLATVTAVRPPARFGGLNFSGDLVHHFEEKPQIGEGWINGGFFVLEPEVFDYIDGDQTVWEREPLERLAEAEELVAYRHQGFWQCVDSLRDLRVLGSLWDKGQAPLENLVEKFSLSRFERNVRGT